jgi:hypothetical protein
MADRKFIPALGHLEVGVVGLFCKIVVGASGAVTSGTGQGITSVTKEAAAGAYTILLNDSYNSLLGASITLLDSADSSPATVAVDCRIEAETVSSTKTVVLQGYNADDGAVDDFAEGAILYVTLWLKNSSV